MSKILKSVRNVRNQQSQSLFYNALVFKFLFNEKTISLLLLYYSLIILTFHLVCMSVIHVECRRIYESSNTFVCPNNSNDCLSNLKKKFTEEKQVLLLLKVFFPIR